MAVRRVIPTLVVCFTVAFGVASCTAVEPPALVVDGQSLSVDALFSRMNSVSARSQASTTQPGPATFSTKAIAQELTLQVYTDLIDAELAARGASPNEADRAQADQGSQSGAATEIQVKKEAVSRLLAEKAFADGAVDRGQLEQQLYDQNKEQLAAVCLHVIELGDVTGQSAATGQVDPALAAQAQQVRTRLATEDFGKVADEVSLLKAQAPGGDGGCPQVGQLAQLPELASAVKTVPVGQISDPIEVQGTFWIVRVDSRKDAPGIETLREQLTPRVTYQVGGRLFEAWLKKQAERASIWVNSRFGSWDSAALQVVPPDGAAEPTVPTTEPSSIQLGQFGPGDASIVGGAPSPGAGPAGAGPSGAGSAEAPAETVATVAGTP